MLGERDHVPAFSRNITVSDHILFCVAPPIFFPSIMSSNFKILTEVLRIMLWRYLWPTIKEMGALSFRCSESHLLWMSQVDKKNPIPPFLSVDFLLFTSFSYLIKVKNNTVVYKQKCVQRDYQQKHLLQLSTPYTRFCLDHGITVRTSASPFRHRPLSKNRFMKLSDW